MLATANLANINPDAALFRDIDRNLRADLTEEALRFMQSVFEEDRSVVDEALPGSR